MSKKLWSIFTDDMDKCIITHAMTGIERHHIFGGTDRTRSEDYGFVVPLHRCIQMAHTEQTRIGQSLTIG